MTESLPPEDEGTEEQFPMPQVTEDDIYDEGDPAEDDDNNNLDTDEGDG